MDIRALRYFVEIARQKSFTLAAEKLFVTQPTLSRQIAELEEELGQTLFDRTTRRLELTEKGLFLFHQAQNILSLVEKTKLDTMSTQDLSGELTISAGETPAVDILAETIFEFQHAHPLVRFDVRSANGLDAKESLRMGTSDFAVINMPTDIEGFSYSVLPRQNRWGLLTRRDGPLANRTEVTPSDLINLPLYMSRQTHVRNRLEGWLNFSFESLKIVGTYNLLYNASLIVRAGGHAVCIDGIVRPDDDIAFLPFAPSFKTDVVLAWSSSGIRRTLNEKFLKAFQEKVARLDALQRDI